MILHWRKQLNFTKQRIILRQLCIMKKSLINYLQVSNII